MVTMRDDVLVEVEIGQGRAVGIRWKASKVYWFSSRARGRGQEWGGIAV